MRRRSSSRLARESSACLAPHRAPPPLLRHLLQKLAEGLEVRLRCTVRAIHHDEHGVMLDASGGVVRCDAVVCTLPLGVLQLAPEFRAWGVADADMDLFAGPAFLAWSRIR